MLAFLKNELPGHKWYRGTTDVVLEWKEPALIRKRMAAAELKKLLRLLPIVFPIFALLGLAAFAGKVWSKGHALSAIPWTGLLLISMLLGVLFLVGLFGDIALLRWDPVVVRLASCGIGKWCNKPDSAIHSDYKDVKTALVSCHPIAPEIQSILLTLSDGEEVRIGLSETIEVSVVLDVLQAHGVVCVDAREPL